MSGENRKVEVFIEPMTRIEGHLAVHAVADREKGIYVDAHTSGTMFRGFEIILKGREPADAIWITQRICGVCPVPHGIASVQAVDMTYNALPTPFAVVIRNLIHLSEEMYDPLLGCTILQGPDYSESVVKKLNPKWWDEAQKRKAERSDLHGYSTIADIMRALEPFKGSLWLKGLEISKLARKMASLLGGKHPHTASFVPGGVAKTVSASDVEKFIAMLSHHIAFSKELVPAFDDLLDFVSEMGYGDAGAREGVYLISYGCYDDPQAYDANYENMSKWGEVRKVTPGVVIDGKLITTDLVEINLGIREYVSKSYYDMWDKREVKSDPLGNEVPLEHPWNRELRPRPGPAKNWGGRYSWITSPRWEDWRNRVGGGMYVVEAGPIARLWVTSMAGKISESKGGGMEFTLPTATLGGFKVSEEHTFEWKIPAKLNSVERLRARAYYYAYSVYVALGMVSQALSMIKDGKADVWSRYKRPKEGIGVGMTEAMRGALAHWCVMRNGKIWRYQIITPTTWNMSPRGPKNEPGPGEEAIVGTPITEEGPELDGIDVVRVVRSFDPCLACSVHLYKGGKVIKEISIT